jgi:hypothetical protein
MQNKTTKEALLSIINRLKNSEIVFKPLYEQNKDKFDRIEANIDGFEVELEHLNNSLNIYKWLLFISKTKEELFENMELLITKPDGSPIEFTDEIKDVFFENSKPFQMFVLLLELCRTKYENVDFESEENMKFFEKMRNEYAENESQLMLEEYIKKETELESTELDIQEGGSDLISKYELTYINNEKAYKEYITTLKNTNQIGGSSQNSDFNRHRFVKVCYTLDKPLPLKIPKVEFLNFKFENNNNKFCIDIEYPWWPTMGNMLPELFNKANIKQCMKEKCVRSFDDVKVADSPDKQECVKSCFITAEPSLFDFSFFPLWSMKKYDPYGVIGGGVSFVRFFMNQIDSTMGKFDPLIDKLAGYLVALIGAIPILGDAVVFLSKTFEDIIGHFAESLIPWFDAYLNIIDKNFEEGFAIYASTIPNSTKMTNASETSVKFLDKMIPLFNKAIKGVEVGTDVLANMNFKSILDTLKGAGNNPLKMPNNANPADSKASGNPADSKASGNPADSKASGNPADSKASGNPADSKASGKSTKSKPTKAKRKKKK